MFDVTSAESPVMISIGRLCEHDGFDYHWSPGSSDAELTDPGGHKFNLITVHHVGIVEPVVQNPRFRVASTLKPDPKPLKVRWKDWVPLLNSLQSMTKASKQKVVILCLHLHPTLSLLILQLELRRYVVTKQIYYTLLFLKA